MDQTTVAAANALSDERTHRTIHLPVTGNLEADAIAAIRYLLQDVSATAAFRILQYLTHCFEDRVEYEKNLSRDPAYPTQHWSGSETSANNYPPANPGITPNFMGSLYSSTGSDPHALSNSIDKIIKQKSFGPLP